MTKKILVIDDEPDLRDVIQAGLVGYAGWDVRTAGTCSEGLTAAMSMRPDLILLDISMPDIDGYQCFEKLRAEPTTAAIPVILLTARVLPRDRRQFSAMGIAGVITKPFDPLNLWREISQMVWPTAD
jgi:CheY-like chemotaxis protein